MAEYITCRNCSSPDCRGCNVYTLAMMISTGKFDCLMNGNRCVDRFADVAPVVRCKDCKHMDIEPCGRYCHVWGFFNGAGDDGFCNYGERKDGEGNGKN